MANTAHTRVFWESGEEIKIEGTLTRLAREQREAYLRPPITPYNKDIEELKDNTIENRKLVLDYVKRHLISPTLSFIGHGGIHEWKSTEDLIMKILKASKTNSSFNGYGKEETKLNKRRSSLDIWRHARYFEKDLSIFEVMRGLYSIKDELHVNYCSVVFRRVFFYPGSCEREAIPLHVYDADRRDEYGLIFNDWSFI